MNRKDIKDAVVCAIAMLISLAILYIVCLKISLLFNLK